jgi:hypothetical protein
MSIKITIPNTSSDVLTFGSANTPTAAQIAGIDSGSSNGQLALYTTASGTSTERVRIDSSGNVGLGVTPSAWGGSYKGFQVAATGAFASNGSNGTVIAHNAYYDGTNDKYLITGAASRVFQFNGGVRFDLASSGSAGSNISFTQAMTLDASGNLLVGKTVSNDVTVGGYILPTGQYGATMAASTNASSTYNVYSTGASNYRFYVGMGGTVYATVTTISGISDIRYKENIRDLDDGLDVVMALKPRKFDWKEGKGADTKNARGFIAQEFETVFPDLIDTWKDEAPEGEEPYKSVRADLIPVLVKAIQEQQALITQLQADVAALKGASA